MGGRVVVVGLGAVTSQGPDARTFWENVRDGKVAIRKVQHLSMDGLRTEIAGEVEKVATPSRELHRPDGFQDRAYEFAVQAAEEAFEAAGIDTTQVAPERWGVVLGTCNAGLLSGREWFLEHRAGRAPDPLLAARSTPQAIAEAIGGAFGFRGPVLSVDTACAAGANAVGLGADLIRQGRADIVLAGGTDALSDVLVAGFNSLESLSPQPAAPYSVDRLGLSLGEGSGMLILVRDDLAEELGASPLAEVAGYGLSADGYHPTAPHPEGLGAARAVRAALRAAGEPASEVDYVNSHGTGTAKNDPAETNATKVGLGEDNARRVAVSSTKSMIGHLLGGAGAVEALITVKAIDEGIAPPTANYTAPDPECDLDYVPNTARPMAIDVAVSNNFAFGGANASVVLRRIGHGSPPPEMPADDVVVTGIGVMTAAGLDADSLWDVFTSGRDVLVDEGGQRVGRVDFRVGDFLAPKERKRVDRLGQMSIISTRAAFADAGLAIDDENRARIGVILGTGVGPMEAMEEFSVPLFDEGPAAANPGVFPNTVYNAAAGQVAMKVGPTGPTSTVCAGHAAGAHALTYAYDLARSDAADAVVALAADALTDTVAEVYRQLVNDAFGIAEGAVALVVERGAHAAARGARAYGRILGYGMASDGRGVGRWDDEGRGVERAVRAALDDAAIAASDIGAVYTSAAGLASADQPEAAALDRVLGAGVPRVSPKMTLGEPMGVGGALTAALALLAYDRGGPGVDGPVLVLSSSLGGTHFATVLGAPG